MGALILGVDPGFTGGLAIYDSSSKTLRDVIDMPLVAQPKNGRAIANKIDVYALALWFGAYSEEVALAVIEDVGPRPEEGVSSVFKFGYGAGVVAGIVAATLTRIHLTPPATWKLLMQLSHDKKLSCTRAKELFPNFAPSFARVKDNGRAEAALIAKFGERLLPLVQRKPVADEL